MAFRFDTGTVRKHEVTPEGYFRGEAVFARDGILEYRKPGGGVRRELRLPEENQKAITSFGLKPVSLEHPPELINSNNSQKYAVGFSDSTVVYDEGGFVRGVILVTDKNAVDSIQRRDTVQISCGYECEIDPTPGVWQGQRYDAVQRKVKTNHIAITRVGRAGPEVAINLDSEDIAYQVDEKKMARLTIDSVTYDEIPENIASVIGSKLTALNEQITSLQEQIEDLEQEKEQALGRADSYEEISNSAITTLGELGYEFNLATNAFERADGKKMPIMDEEEDDEEEDEDETPPTKKHHKKDSISDLLDTWRKAEEMGLDRSRFDSDLSTQEIHATVLQEALPDIDLSRRSPAWIAGVFDSLYMAAQSGEEEYFSRTDSADPDIYASNLQDMIKYSKTSLLSQQQPQDDKLGDAWQQPLSLSK